MTKLGHHPSEETRRKMSDSHKGEKNPLYGKRHTEKSLEKMREYQTGKHHSEETRRKMSDSKKGKPSPMKGRKHTEEAIKKMRKPRKNRTLSEETRLKISESKKGRKHTEETRRKMSEARMGRKLSIEICKKISEATKGENNPNWKGGISFEPYCVKFDNPFKERCRNFFGRVCVECGKTEVENGRKLQVHHVNFDKMTCCNDAKPLYVPLCKNCHPRTNFNREYWEQHFTDMINEKYGGKCYLPKPEVCWE